jgi:predicted branched-subunit amino acid permease
MGDCRLGLSRLGERSLPGLRAGFVDGLTFVPSTLLLGVIFGAGASAAGLGRVAAIAMSALVISGSAQFAALPLWQENGIVVIVSALVLSLRFGLMTASMAPRLAGRPAWLRAALGVCVTDENYALAASRRGGELASGYVAGSWLGLYLAWLGGTIIGVVFGAQVPPLLQAPLEAVFPIVFLVIVVLTCTSRSTALVAGLGGLLGLLGSLYLPGGWHVIVAGLAASLAGPLLARALGERRLP